MSKWYIIENPQLSQLPDTRTILLEEKDDVVYERFIINDDKKSWKVTKDSIFSSGYNSERFKRFCDLHINIVKEITEKEAFIILL